jgi:hypothetical protein
VDYKDGSLQLAIIVGAGECGQRIIAAVNRSNRKGPPYLDIAPKDVKIQMADDVAIMTFHLGEGGASRRTIVWQNRHGKWLIIHLHASNILPPSGMDRRSK